MDPLLVLVSGPPGSGKTTLARRLASDLQIPLLTKDTIKEALGRTLAVDSLERSRALGAASADALFALTALQLDLGIPVVVDHAFHQDLADLVVPLVEWSTARLVHCHAPRAILTERVFARPAQGERDPVHVEGDRVIDWDRYEPMELLDVPVLLVETSDGYRPDYPTVLSFVEGAG
jgi:predicted kinase